MGEDEYFRCDWLEGFRRLAVAGLCCPPIFSQYWFLKALYLTYELSFLILLYFLSKFSIGYVYIFLHNQSNYSISISLKSILLYLRIIMSTVFQAL